MRESYISYIYDETKSLDGYRMNTSHLENKTTEELEKEVYSIETRIINSCAKDKADEYVYEAELAAAKKNDNAFIVDNDRFKGFPVRSRGFYEKEIGYKNSDDPQNVKLLLKEINKIPGVNIDIKIDITKEPSAMELAMKKAKKTKRSRQNRP